MKVGGGRTCVVGIIVGVVLRRNGEIHARGVEASIESASPEDVENVAVDAGREEIDARVEDTLQRQKARFEQAHKVQFNLLGLQHPVVRPFVNTALCAACAVVRVRVRTC